MREELRICERCSRVLARYGIKDRACRMILFAMVWAGIGYWDAVTIWADYETPGTWDAHRWHTELCRLLLMNWIDEGPGMFFDKLEEEVKEIEDGVSA
jgi:hypothetical protein